MSPEDEAVALIEEYYATRRACIASVPTCDVSGLASVLVDPQLALDTNQVFGWKSASIELTNVETLTFVVLEVNLEHRFPHMILCERDGAIQVERLPGLPERVVDDDYIERISEAHLVRSAGGWRIEGFAHREEVEGQVGALCS